MSSLVSAKSLCLANMRLVKFASFLWLANLWLTSLPCSFNLSLHACLVCAHIFCSNLSPSRLRSQLATPAQRSSGCLVADLRSIRRLSSIPTRCAPSISTLGSGCLFPYIRQVSFACAVSFNSFLLLFPRYSIISTLNRCRRRLHFIHSRFLIVVRQVKSRVRDTMRSWQSCSMTQCFCFMAELKNRDKLRTTLGCTTYVLFFQCFTYRMNCAEVAFLVTAHLFERPVLCLLKLCCLALCACRQHVSPRFVPLCFLRLRALH